MLLYFAEGEGGGLCVCDGRELVSRKDVCVSCQGFFLWLLEGGERLI